MKFTFVSVSKSSVTKKNLSNMMMKIFKELRKAKVKNHKKLSQELTLVFVSSTEMKRINAKFRKMNKVTDVLSFESENELGELILCTEEIKKRAKDHELSYKEELLYNLIHGTLHLLGYDHEKTEIAAQQMFKIQDSLFEKLLDARI